MPSNAEYMRQWRRSRPDKALRNSQLNAARRRAQVRLADRHPEEFRRLVEDECAAAGIDPPHEYRPLEVHPVES